MKKLLIIAAVVVVLGGTMVTAGLVYVGYRVKNGIDQETAKTGGERRREASRSSPSAETGGVRIDACSLLSKAEASRSTRCSRS